MHLLQASKNPSVRTNKKNFFLKGVAGYISCAKDFYGKTHSKPKCFKMTAVRIDLVQNDITSLLSSNCEGSKETASEVKPFQVG